MGKKYKNVFYFNSLNKIGGTEQFLYYLSCLYKDMVVFYKDINSDKAQIERLSENIEVHRYKGGVIECDRFFANYNPDIIDNVIAREYIQVVHMCYKSQNRVPHIHSKITKCIGVSEVACREFTELTGRECECIYNPCIVDKPRKVLKLISATRLSEEKGREEMIKLGNILDNAKIPYIWLVFTNDWNRIQNPHIVYMEPTLDIDSYIKESDYLVQLSSAEAYCFSVVQSLMLDTGVIVRDLPVWSEIGVKNGENGFILDFDMRDIPVDEIYKGLKSFKYTPPVSRWDKFLDNDSEYDPNRAVECRASRKFFDVVGGKWREKGEILKISEKRKNILTDLDLIDTI
mgnify:CR=1 FL=1